MNLAALNHASTRDYFLPACAAVLASFLLLSVVISTLSLPESQTLPTHTAKAQTTTPNQTDAVDFSQISTWHLFGQSENAGNGDMAIVPQELKLIGVFYLGSKNQARAIIETSDQTQKTYPVNAKLPGGEILLAIEHDKVILLINNEEASLPLTQHEPSPDAAETPPTP